MESRPPETATTAVPPRGRNRDISLARSVAGTFSADSSPKRTRTVMPPLCRQTRALYLLRTHVTGAFLGIAWSAWNIVGWDCAWRILHRAHLAEHAPWVLSHAVVS